MELLERSIGLKITGSVTCALFSHALPASPFLLHSSPLPLRSGEEQDRRRDASTEPSCCAAWDGHPQGAKMLQMATCEDKYTAFNHQPGHKGNLVPTAVCKISPRQRCTAEEAALHSALLAEQTLAGVGDRQDALWQVSTNSLHVAC